MTNERAIELLNRISDSQFDGIHGDERREALEMAVRALESNLVQESGDLVQDLVKDCISRQAAIDALDKHIDTFDAIDTNYLCGLRTAMSILKEMPSAQSQRKKGKWIDNDKINFPQCSECGMWIDVMQQSGEMNFCPNCGADMRGDEMIYPQVDGITSSII